MEGPACLEALGIKLDCDVVALTCRGGVRMRRRSAFKLLSPSNVQTLASAMR